LSCVSTDGWFDQVKDEGNLASFPNLEAVSMQCAESISPAP